MKSAARYDCATDGSWLANEASHLFSMSFRVASTLIFFPEGEAAFSAAGEADFFAAGDADFSAAGVAEPFSKGVDSGVVSTVAEAFSSVEEEGDDDSS